MQHLFLNKKLSLIAKGKGFDEVCLYNYSELYGFTPNINRLKNSSGNNRFVSAPLYQQIIDWFREKHHIDIYVGQKLSKLYEGVVSWEKGILHTNKLSYYEALNKAIEEAFKLI